MTAGYSKKSLPDKLGIKANSTIAIINAPQHYGKTLQPLPNAVTIVTKHTGKLFPFIHFFTQSKKELANIFSSLKQSLQQDGMLWISWPKKTAKLLPSDLEENTIRNLGLQLGLVDVKVCAVDETWSGLKFVIRKELRT